MNLYKKMRPIFAAGAFMMVASAASAVTLGFSNITGNNATDAAIGEAQLSVDVTDAGGGLVDFKFNNTPGLLLRLHAPSIPPKYMKMYFGDGWEDYVAYDSEG